MKFALMLLSLMAVVSSAAAFTIAEGKGTPDFSNTLSAPTDLGSLSFGLNTISGEVERGVGGIDDTRDAFYFLLPEVWTIAAISVVDFTSNATSGGSLFRLYDTNPPVAGAFLTSDGVVVGDQVASGSGIPISDAWKGLQGTVYAIEVLEFTTGEDNTYTLEILVVPEPSVVSMLALGAIALGLILRRRR